MGTLQVGGTTLGVKNAVTNKVDLSNTGTLDSVPFFVCRAWVNFDGVDTSSANPLSFTNTNATNHGDANSAGETLCAIRGSGNVSKVVKNGTGDYTITFTTAMPHANFVASGMVAENFTAGGRSDRVVQPIRETMVVGSFRVGSWAHSTGNLIDCAGLLIMVVA